MRRSAAAVIAACLVRPRLVAAIEAEVDAQIRWFLDRGVRPTHLDSHRHIHAFSPIFARVVALARRYDIRFVRRHREVLGGRGWPAAGSKQKRVSRLLNVFGAVNSAVWPAETVWLWGGITIPAPRRDDLAWNCPKVFLVFTKKTPPRRWTWMKNY